MTQITKWTLGVACIACVLSWCLAPAVVIAASDKAPEPKLTDEIACPISGNPINEEASAKHHDGRVFFCCEKCLAAFKKSPEKFATKANFQLVATKQYRQKACPVSGRPTKSGTEIAAELGDAEVEVGFCCKNCKGAAAGKEGDDRLDMLFGKKAFGKAFQVAKSDKQD